MPYIQVNGKQREQKQHTFTSGRRLNRLHRRTGVCWSTTTHEHRQHRTHRTIMTTTNDSNITGMGALGAAAAALSNVCGVIMFQLFMLVVARCCCLCWAVQHWCISYFRP